MDWVKLQLSCQVPSCTSLQTSNDDLRKKDNTNKPLILSPKQAGCTVAHQESVAAMGDIPM
jgi:hypothetical protein